MKKKLVLNLSIFSFVLCFTGSAQNLEVDGVGKFNLNGGSISMSTPGGWPGIIAIENGTFHRRDITFKTSGIGLLASLTSAPPTDNEGIWIAEGGNIGIGTYSPDGKLDIDFGATGSIVGGTPGGNGPGWIFHNAQNERWDMLVSLDGIRFNMGGSTNSFIIHESGKLILNNTSGVILGDFHLKQQSSSGTANGILLQHPGGNNYWNTYIDDNSDYSFAYNGFHLGYIRADNGNYVAISDQRFKSDIQPISNVLRSVSKLRPVTYKFNSHGNTKNRSWGFIAQEVEEIFPDFVSEKEGIKGLSYDNFAVIAIKAIQEQQAEIENLRKRIEQLESQ